MGNTERKARKRAGIPFVHPVKVGTARSDRAVPQVRKKVDGIFGIFPSNRAMKRLKQQQDAAEGKSRWV